MNYAVSVGFRNSDDDGVGLLFRYQNPSNYYKVDLDSQRSFRKLFKVVDGVETTLAAEPNGYWPGQDYELRVMVTNNVIRVRLNGMLFWRSRAGFEFLSGISRALLLGQPRREFL